MASTFVVMGPDMSVIIMLPTIGSLCFLFSCIFSAPLVKQTVGQWEQGNENPVKCLDSTWAFACCLFLKGSPQSRHLQIDTPPSTGDSLTIFSSQAASTSEEHNFYCQYHGELLGVLNNHDTSLVIPFNVHV